MNLKNLELPVLRFKSEMGERCGNISTHDMVSTVMEQAVDYTNLIETIRRAEMPEDWADIKELIQGEYNPVSILWHLRQLIDTLHIAQSLFDTIDAEIRRTKVAADSEKECKELRKSLDAALRLLDAGRKTNELDEKIAEKTSLVEERRKIVENMEKQVAEQK